MPKPSYKVLIVEDDFKVAEINAQYVRRVAGFKVLGITKTGKETLAFLSGQVPDLILLDTYIPDVENLELLWKIRQQYKNIDVIMVTAAKEVANIEEAMRGGIADYIIKPFDFNRFKLALEDYAEKKNKFKAKEKMDQKDVDQLMSVSGDASKLKEAEKDLPKGISAFTLEKTESIIINCVEGLTAEELGNRIGVSRITARRYLEYLVYLKKVIAELKYGKVGRPERRYYKA